MAKKSVPAFTDPVELEQRVEAYFEHCAASRREIVLRSGDVRVREESPTILGLALWLDVSRETIYSYINKDDCRELDKDIYNTISDILARARSRCEAALVRRAMDGDCDPRTAALLLTNYGYATKAETEQRVTVSVTGAAQDAAEWSK